MSPRNSGSGWPPSSAERVEAPRDQDVSSFTLPLRRTFGVHSSILAVIFVDPEGECVDYCSAIDPFETKVIGAQLQVTCAEVRRFARRVSAGRSALTQIVGTTRSFVLREVGERYALIVTIEGTFIHESVLAATEACVRVLRDESALPIPSWDPFSSLEVETRDARGWEFAPKRYVEHGERYEVESVLGRWQEGGGLPGGVLTCFRIRNCHDDELTLAYDEVAEVWLRW